MPENRQGRRSGGFLSCVRSKRTASAFSLVIDHLINRQSLRELGKDVLARGKVLIDFKKTFHVYKYKLPTAFTKTNYKPNEYIYIFLI